MYILHLYLIHVCLYMCVFTIVAYYEPGVINFKYFHKLIKFSQYCHKVQTFATSLLSQMRKLECRQPGNVLTF